MSSRNPIVFVCEHGAAKSILAAALFNHLAERHGSGLRAVARATEPDAQLSQATLRGLSGDGLSPTESTPQRLSVADVQSAQRVVSFCELPAGYHAGVEIEQWEGVPAVSENYETARDAILERIHQLLVRIQCS